MAWRQLLLVSCLSAAMFLSMPQEGSSASVGINQVSGQEAQEGECRGQPGVQGEWASSCGSPGELVLVVTGLFLVSGVDQKVFLQESDASSFLKKHGKRLPKPRNELIAENRQKLWTDELHREYSEELQELESFAEVNEQKEKNREAIDQWHQWH
ncbi:unique cartilage matrix-associated protein isoform X2 [Pteropus vampyrus]|uniref:Unique cartilage matrix-associated protein n=1 Tax=Pteropus vampyrus TaxID=132908 RepID=A0A6P3QCC7_PTEVA|nr:unique cartilage matrix-associated protein isoform X2 [Pteropus vampyrus]